MTSPPNAPHLFWVHEGADPPGRVAVQAQAALTDGKAYHMERIEGLALLAQRSDIAHATAMVLAWTPSAEIPDLSAWPLLPSFCADLALVVLTDPMPEPWVVRLLEAGVQDVVWHADAPSLPQRLALSIQRKRIEAEWLRALALDVRTGLPNRQHLIELTSQLLALREREQRSASLLVLRIDGVRGVEAQHGLEVANVARRKLAVRLRAGVRASDVVASLGDDVFAVLLAAMESPADAHHVIDKLTRSLREPLHVAGADVRLRSSVGEAHFPKDGSQPEPLIRHALAQALLGAYKDQDAANG